MPWSRWPQFGDRVVGTLRDYMVDPETPVAARRALPLVLQQIGTQATHAVLGESLLDPDAEVRYGVISALNKLQELHPTWRVDPTMLETLLDAEILGHLRSYQMIGALLPALADPAPVMAPLKAAMEQELERIFRLLKLRFPHQDLHSAYVGVQSTNPVVHDNALEFLENILSPQLRTQLVPLLDSAVPTRERVALAHRMLSAQPPSPTEAVRMLLQGDDPWLKACGVYTIGALGLKALLPELDELEASPDPLLREAVKQARAKVLG